MILLLLLRCSELLYVRVIETFCYNITRKVCSLSNLEKVDCKYWLSSLKSLYDYQVYRKNEIVSHNMNLINITYNGH